ncbi:DMT family transporter [Streptomyces daqingensis]|uniref:DMT family transporter n=1 Tax=Streptomyces daqingensis TaxID=1472640 RepID=UPI001E491DB0|nr:DMT family transporter [Streptomyces daqingensis]
MPVPAGSAVNALIGAVLLALLSAVCYATAAIVQERIAATTPPSRYGLLRSPRWWGAVALNGLGAVLHVGALGLGPLSVVQPLGVLTLVLAPPLAAVMVRRPVSRTAWRGIALVSGGLAVLLVLTGSTPNRSLAGAEQPVLAAAVACALVLLVATAATAGRRSRLTRTVSLATAAGVAYGAASVFIKTVADSWGTSPLLVLAPLMGLIGVLAATGLATSQASYRGGGLATPLATATVVNPAFAAVVGIVLLDEGFLFGAPGAAGAALAACATVRGLFVLAVDHSGRGAPARDPAASTPVRGPGPVMVRPPGRLSRAVHRAAAHGHLDLHPRRARICARPHRPRRVTGSRR